MPRGAIQREWHLIPNFQGSPMSHVPRDLTEDFPEHSETIQRLKQENAHFTKFANDDHDVNRAIHRAETDIESTSDDHATELRKRRLHLKDEIGSRLAATVA
jgi:uncharacterized protein YdcH (DUF465 family)